MNIENFILQLLTQQNACKIKRNYVNSINK